MKTSKTRIKEVVEYKVVFISLFTMRNQVILMVLIFLKSVLITLFAVSSGAKFHTFVRLFEKSVSICVSLKSLQCEWGDLWGII